MTQASKDPLRFSSAALRRAKTIATHARSAAWAAGGRRDPHGGLRILFYHRIADERDPLAVRVDRFREQMELLGEQGFRVLDVAAAWRTVMQPAGAGERVIGLSFDDGYRDVAENALPVLEELGFGATVFIVTEAVDGRVEFGWYERTPPLLGWAEIEHLDATSPLCFEAHSATHANLLSLSLDAARRELSQSKGTLESHLGRPVRGFCYPAGLFGGRERQLAAECGFELAVGSEPGANDVRTDPLMLKRTQVEPGDRIYDFRAKIGGGHDRPLPFRASYRQWRFGVPTVADQSTDHDGAAAADRGAGTGESLAGP